MSEEVQAIVTQAIADAMDWNVRAYGKLACEEDAEFFAACALRALNRAGFIVQPGRVSSEPARKETP